MKITINEEEYSVLAGSTFNWVADDTQDSGIVQYITPAKQPVKPFTLAKYEFSSKDGETVYDSGYMFTAADNVETYTKANVPLYKHTITLVELTKISEKFIIPAISLTTVDLGLASQLLYAVENINVVISGKANMHTTEPYKYHFEITDRLFAKLANRAGEVFVFSKSTAREIFDEILSAINCRAVISSVSDTKGLMLDYIDLNEITDVDEDLSQRNSTALNNNADDYAGRIYSEVSNATPQNLLHIVDSFKVKYGVTSATSADGILTLPYPIEYATQFSCCFNKEITVRVLDGTTYLDVQTTIPTTQFFNAINSVYNGVAEDYFVDKEYYDTITDGDERKKYIYYERGASEVDISRTYKILFFTKTEFNTFAQNIVARYVLENFDDVMPAPATGSYTPGDNFAVTTTFSYDETIFDMYYAPLIDCVVDIPKNIDIEEDRALSVNDNQSANIIDLDRYGRNLLGKVQRTGNNELFIDVEADAYTEILSILSRLTIDDKKYVISKVSLQALTNNNTTSDTQDSNYYRVRYYLTENYNNLSEKIGLSKQKEIYQIPLVGYKTIIPYKKHIAIEHYTGTIATTSTEDVASVLAKTLISDENSSSMRIENCQLSTYLQRDKIGDFTLPVCAWGTANTLNFLAKFYDNYSAGLSLDNNYSAFRWIGGKKVAYNPYTTEEGILGKLQDVKLGRYTNARTAAGVLIQPRKSDEAFTAYTNDSIEWHKDRAEALVLQYIYDIRKTNDDDNYIVIGNPLITRNALITDTEPLYVYEITGSIKPYDTMKPADAVLKGKASDCLEVVYSTTDDGKQAAVLRTTLTDGLGAFIICDNKGLIYLGVNNGMVYFDSLASGIAFYEE